MLLKLQGGTQGNTVNKEDLISAMTNQFGYNRFDVIDILDKCQSRGFVYYKGPINHLFCEVKGWEFIVPFKFFDSVLGEYGQGWSFFFGIGGFGLIYLIVKLILGAMSKIN